MVVSLKIVSNVWRFKPALNLNRVLADLNRDSNSLNSISGSSNPMYPCSIILCIQVLLLPSYVSRFSYPMYPGFPILCIQVLQSYVSRFFYHMYPGSPIICIQVLLSYVSRFSYILCIQILQSYVSRFFYLCIQVLLSFVSRFSYPMYPGSPILSIQVHLCYVFLFSYWMYICVFDVSRPQIKDNSLPCHDPWYTDNLEILNSRTILKFENDLYPTPLNRLTNDPFVRKKSYRNLN